MKVRVIKGTNQIGGCITEITSDSGTKIIIDYGEDLTDDINVSTKYPIKGLTFGKSKYKGVFITHSHGDHIGLISDIKKDIPIYVEETSYKIFKVSNAFSSSIPFNGDVNTFKFEDKIIIDDLVITPYRTDHSAYNSSMFLIENNGKKVLHLGDYRKNGYSAEIFYDNLKKIGRVDLLITEGTNVTKDSENNTEIVLKEKAKEIFRKYKQVFVLQASTNLDRLKSFKEAALEENKKFILDISTANILKAIDDENYKYLNEDNITVWVPNTYLNKNSKFYEYKEGNFYETYIEPFKNLNIKNEYTHGEYVMLVKTSMLNDIIHNLKRYRDNACLIYSMWPGYKDPNRPNTLKTIEFIDKLKELKIKEEYLHTSGHADVKTIKEIFKIINPKKAIGIHTKDNEKLSKLFKDYVIIKDKEYVEV